uniref:Putative secreted protein n=1 Tax=Anopheles darlingi TaxID=43151 RepID=A0A2M4DSQ5_ANODA
MRLTLSVASSVALHLQSRAFHLHYRALLGREDDTGAVSRVPMAVSCEDKGTLELSRVLPCAMFFYFNLFLLHKLSSARVTQHFRWLERTPLFCGTTSH